MSHLRIDDFRAWLEDQARDVVVGQSDNCTGCPIATWQREEFDIPLSVSADTIVDMVTGDEFEPPVWVGEFVEGIDRLHADEGPEEYDYRQEPVVAYECLRIIEQIQQ